MIIIKSHKNKALQLWVSARDGLWSIFIFWIIIQSLIPQGLSAKEGNAPNILCITCEDISPYLHCYGDPLAKTPNLDRLAAEGIKFTRVFSCSGVCAPSRFALITGMYPTAAGADNMRTNHKDLPDGIPPYEAVPAAQVKCVSELMRAAGYYCTNNQKTDYQFKAPVTAWDESAPAAHWKNRPAGMPFFSIFNLMSTHESQVWDRANDPVTIRPEDVLLPPYYPDTPGIRREVARVYSNITIMDRETGELIKELEKDGLLDNTIIIFYSDHGGPLPRGKRELYDSGLLVPMIVRFPDKYAAGTENNNLISFIDIPATILSLAGVKPPAYMQGRAFLGTYKTTKRKYIFAARDRMDEQMDVRRAVRDKRFKYIRNYHPEIGCYQNITFRLHLQTMQDLLRLRDENKLNENQMYWFRKTKAEEELYDLASDPHELHNLAMDPAYQVELKRLREVHQEWQVETGDQPLRSEKELVWSMWPGGIQPDTKTPQFKVDGDFVEIICDTPGASIAYQINGMGSKKNHWFLYQIPIHVADGSRVMAKAIRIGFRESEEISLIK